MYKILLNTMKVVVGSSVLASSLVLADQTNAVFWEYDSQQKEGYFQKGETSGGDDQVYLNLSSNQDFFFEGQVLVVFQDCGYDPKTTGNPVLNLDEIITNPKAKPVYGKLVDQGPRWKVCPDKKAILFGVKETAQLDLHVDFLRPVDKGLSPRLAGKVYKIPAHLLKKTSDPEQLAKVMTEKQPLANLTIDLYYRLNAKDNSWSRGDYQHVFGSASDGAKKTSDYKKLASILAVDLQGYRSNIPLPKLNAKPSFNLPMDDMYFEGSSDPADKFNELYKEPVKLSFNTPPSIIDLGFSHVLSGKFSTIWSADHRLHPAFGWRVEAWSDESGSWQLIASDWVQSNGSWQLSVDNEKNYQGDHLRISYRSNNRYFRPQNRIGDTYSWHDDDHYDIPRVFDTGHRVADTDGGQFNGVGELVDAAMHIWVRLSEDANIDPVPAEPLTIYFPNTWHSCDVDNPRGTPWSCANAKGEIWLTAIHGINASVVAHEFAHQLNNKFWHGKKPKNSGGSHFFNQCYSNKLGMTLREGFANFISAWVGYPQGNVAAGAFNDSRWVLPFDIEAQDGTNDCRNGWEAEVWVARTFWDLYDSHNDGRDTLRFHHDGAVIGLYLDNEVVNHRDARDIRFFERIYRDAVTAGDEDTVSGIFRRNRM